MSVYFLTGPKLADHYSKIDGEVQKETSLKIVEHMKALGLSGDGRVDHENVIRLERFKRVPR